MYQLTPLYAFDKLSVSDYLWLNDIDWTQAYWKTSKIDKRKWLHIALINISTYHHNVNLQVRFNIIIIVAFNKITQYSTQE